MKTTSSRKMASRLPVLGWREWLALPEFGVPAIKVKVDTGARSSALHAHNLRMVQRGGEEYALFEVRPLQRKSTPSYEVEAVVVDRRKVTSSGGHQEIRPVIVVDIEIMGNRWPISDAPGPSGDSSPVRCRSGPLLSGRALADERSLRFRYRRPFFVAQMIASVLLATPMRRHIRCSTRNISRF